MVVIMIIMVIMVISTTVIVVVIFVVVIFMIIFMIVVFMIVVFMIVVFMIVVVVIIVVISTTVIVVMIMVVMVIVTTAMSSGGQIPHRHATDALWSDSVAAKRFSNFPVRTIGRRRRRLVITILLSSILFDSALLNPVPLNPAPRPAHDLIGTPHSPSATGSRCTVTLVSPILGQAILGRAVLGHTEASASTLRPVPVIRLRVGSGLFGARLRRTSAGRLPPSIGLTRGTALFPAGRTIAPLTATVAALAFGAIWG